MYSRWTFLDNLVTPWLLLAFVLAASPRRSISAATGAALSFAMAALTKETALVVLPALVWAMAQNLDRRNRPQVVAVAGFSGLLLMAMYPLYALYKGELLERPGQNSLLGTAKWQLVERESSGSLLDPGSPTATCRRPVARHRPVAPAGRAGRHPGRPAGPAAPAGGPGPGHPVAGPGPRRLRAVHARGEPPALERAGRRRAPSRSSPATAGWPPSGRWPSRRAGAGWSRARGPLTTGLAAVCLAVVLVGAWTPTLRHMTLEARQEPPLWSATQWLADNVPRDRVLVVHDSIWTDLVHHYGFDPQPIIVYKLDTDPAVREQPAPHRLPGPARTGTTPPRRAWPSTPRSPRHASTRWRWHGSARATTASGSTASAGTGGRGSHADLGS